jgi:type VI secretion system protein ImpI
MTISLKIDNIDQLPDGGPVSYRADKRGFEIGREHRDWTLPDPNMFISGRHCEVRFEKGGYWLYDVSRNGTFLNGSATRVKSPYQLANGDRLKIGHYLVSVSIDDEGGDGDSDAADAFVPARSGDNIWDVGGPASPPIDRRELIAPAKRGQRSADFAERHFELPPVRSSNAFDDFAQPAPAAANPAPVDDPFAGPAGVSESPFDSPPQPPVPRAEPAPPAARTPSPFDSSGGESFAPASFAPPPREMPQPPRPAPPPGAAAVVSAGVAGGESLLRGIAAGAGVSPSLFLQRDQSDVAAEIGAVLRIMVEELAILLKARAAAKLMAKAGNRTMISAVDNNPLKFVPRPEEVLEIMFARRAGYLDAKHSVSEAFQDLKTHEFATYAAMQKALSRLLEDLSPEAIEKKVASSAFSSRKSRAWETFVATWEAKEKPHENGMLDVFLSYFSDAYAKASKKK